MKIILFTIFLLVPASQSRAQDDPEYLMEGGAGIGVVSYEGDFNSNILKDMQPMASLLLRRNFNPYMGLRLATSYGKLKGKSSDAGTYYPDYQESVYTFNNSLIDVSLTYEYNFWPYGTGHDYRGAKRFTPFIFGGIGATGVFGGEKKEFTANVPLGLGIKYKIGERLNLGVEWAMHFSLSDKLDGVKDPYYVQSSGLFKNTDCYSTLQVTLTYSFMAKCRVCNNDE